VTADALAPDGTYEALLGTLTGQARHTRIAMVGHEPDLGGFAARLFGSRRRLEFKKGGVCRIDIESIPPVGHGTLRWFVTPAILRAVAK
jgi:phosphohistidine phosphatase SixA